MLINDLVVEPGREEHIARHRVTLSEAEEVIFDNPLVSRTRQRRLRLIGQTAAGRYLTVIVGARGGGVYALVTARDADQAERRLCRARRR